MAPTICYRDVPHKIPRRHQRPIAAATAPDFEEEVITTGSGGGMSLATSGRTRMVVKNQRASSKKAAVRRRLRGVAWFLQEFEDSRISTTTNAESAMVAKSQNQQRENSAKDFEGSEAEFNARVGRLADTLESRKRSGGLLDITMRTVELIKRNQLLQLRLSMLQEETKAFVKSVMSNPENQRVDEETKNLSDGAQDPAVSGSC